MSAAKPAADPLYNLRASQQEQIAAHGGDATPQGRELMLSYLIQHWVAAEIVMGTDPSNAVNSLVHACTINLAQAARNLAEIYADNPQDVFERIEDAVHDIGRDYLQSMPVELGPTIHPAVKQ